MCLPSRWRIPEAYGYVESLREHCTPRGTASSGPSVLDVRRAIASGAEQYRHPARLPPAPRLEEMPIRPRRPPDHERAVLSRGRPVSFWVLDRRGRRGAALSGERPVLSCGRGPFVSPSAGAGQASTRLIHLDRRAVARLGGSLRTNGRLGPRILEALDGATVCIARRSRERRGVSRREHQHINDRPYLRARRLLLALRRDQRSRGAAPAGRPGSGRGGTRRSAGRAADAARQSRPAVAILRGPDPTSASHRSGVPDPRTRPDGLGQRGCSSRRRTRPTM